MRENKYGIGISTRLFLGTIAGVLFAWQGVAFAQTPQSSPTLTRTAGNTISAARVSSTSNKWQWELSGVQVQDPAGEGDATSMGMITYRIVDSGYIARENDVGGGTWEIINGDETEDEDSGTVKLIVPSTHNAVIAPDSAPVNNAVFRFIGQMPTTRTAQLMVSYTNPDGATGSLELELEIPAYNQRPVLRTRSQEIEYFEDNFLLDELDRPGEGSFSLRFALTVQNPRSLEGRHEGNLTPDGVTFETVPSPSEITAGGVSGSLTVHPISGIIHWSIDVASDYFTDGRIAFKFFVIDSDFEGVGPEHRVQFSSANLELISVEDLPIFIQNGEVLLTELSSTPITLRRTVDNGGALYLGQIPGMMEVVDDDHPAGDRTSTLTFTIQDFSSGTAGDWHLNISSASTFHTGAHTMVIGNIANLAAASEALNDLVVTYTGSDFIGSAENVARLVITIGGADGVESTFISNINIVRDFLYFNIKVFLEGVQ